jgi:xylulokinase
MQLMGIDIGSTSIKAGLFSPEGKLLSLGRTETPLDTRKLTDGGSVAVWQPDRLWEGAAAAVRGALKELQGAPDVRGVAVTGFGSDAVPLDKNGRELFPFLSFYEKATIEQRDEYVRIMDPFESYSISGICPWYYLTLFKMMWLRKYFPALFETAAVWLNVTDYINFKLCGRAATDYSEASTTIAFDQTGLSWSETVLEKTGIPKAFFPRLLPAGTVLGTVTKEAAEQTGLPESTSVVLGGHDNVTSCFASGCEDNDVVTVTGTFESIMISSSAPVITRHGMESNIVCEKGVAEGKHVLIGVQYAGGIIEWLRKTLFNSECDSNESLFSDIENSSAGSKGLMMLPHIFGSVTPVQDAYSRGCFIGISGTTEKIDFLRAAVEGINYQTRLIYETLTSVTGIVPSEILNIGGAVYSSFWMQNRADILGVPVKVLEVPEATALGAAMLAGIGSGVYNSFGEARNSVRHGSSVFYPAPECSGLYEGCYNDAYKHLYPAAKQINHYIAEKF